MPKLVSLEDWIKAYVEQHPFPGIVRFDTSIETYLGEFAGTLLTAAVADKLLQEALKPEPEDGPK